MKQVLVHCTLYVHNIMQVPTLKCYQNTYIRSAYYQANYRNQSELFSPNIISWGEGTHTSLEFAKRTVQSCITDVSCPQRHVQACILQVGTYQDYIRFLVKSDENFQMLRYRNYLFYLLIGIPSLYQLQVGIYYVMNYLQTLLPKCIPYLLCDYAVSVILSHTTRCSVNQTRLSAKV